MIIIVGRGHSGTRAIAQTLHDSGVYMGQPLNETYDLMPPDSMYEAARAAGEFVQQVSETEWDFTELLQNWLPDTVTGLITAHLTTVCGSSFVKKGFKLPETTLLLPWIVKLFPEAHYIEWVRDPRDNILGVHLTDDLATFNVPVSPATSTLRQRAVSWKYHYDLIKATPKPAHWLRVRFEDFVLNQESTLDKLETFLGMRLVKVPVFSEPVGRWKEHPTSFAFLDAAMQELGYK